jgi:hypothetical protein
MSRRTAELAIRVLGIVCLAALWRWAFAEPDADPTVRNGVLAIATVGMVAAQQPWVAWLRRAGLAVVLWPLCIMVTALVMVLLATMSVDLLPGGRGASVTTVGVVLMATSLGEALLLGAWVLPWLWRRWAPPAPSDGARQ